MPRVSEDSILTMKAHGLKKGLWFFIPLLVIGVFGHNMQYKYDNVHNCMCSHPGVMSYSVCLGKRLSHFEITPRIHQNPRCPTFPPGPKRSGRLWVFVERTAEGKKVPKVHTHV